MFCHNCGKQLSLEARHCAYCGAPCTSKAVEKPENMAALIDGIVGDVKVNHECLFRVRPAFFKIATAYILAAFFAIGATVLIAYLGGSLLWVWISILILFSGPLVQHLKRNQTIYTLKPEKIEIEQGLFSRTTQNLALRHINNVAVYQSLSERLLGIGDVLIDSAGTTDRIALKSIRNPRQYANLILTQLQR